jgi:Bacteriophage HK97-gp10, putative tail-component
MGAVVQQIKNPGLDPVQWNNACNAMLAYLKSETPVRTGVLRDGWKMNMGSSVVSFVNNTPYAEWVNDGTPRMAPRDMTGKLLSVAEEIADKYGKHGPSITDDTSMSQKEYREMRLKQLGFRSI